MGDRDLADFDEREFQKTNTKLYLGNLPGHYPGNPKQQKDAARLYVENLCQRYGQPTDILVNVEKRFAFVTFPNKEAAQYAIYHLAETNVGGNVLHVSWSKPSKEQLAARDARRARENADYAKKEGGQVPAKPEGHKPEAKVPAEKEHAPADAHKPEGQKPADEKPAEKVGAKAVEPVVVEKPDPVRFASQQKVAVKQTQQPRQAQAKKPAQTQQPKPPQQTKAAPQQQKAAPKPVPQKFKVTVQNETTPGLPTVVLSISFDEWTKYICPLISNNNSSTVV